MKNSNAQHAFQGAMQDQACHWIARLRSDTVSEEDQQAFALWLAANPAHRKAMDAMLDLWDDLGVVRFMPVDEEESAPDSVHASRRRWLGTGLALAASVCLALLFAPQLGLQPEPTQYRTGIGERLSVTLEDGSSIQLNTDTALSVTFDHRQRDLKLQRGEAYFEVAHDTQRPFVVEAGNLEVRALGTAFNIQLEGEQSLVTVTEGVVRVTERDAPASRPARSALLYGSQALSGDGEGLSDPRRIEPSRELAWRDGKLIAEEMRLADLVDELSRYHPQRVFVAEPEIAQRTISGVFKLEDLDGILLALEHTAGVRSITLEDGSIQLIRAPL